MRKLMIQAVGLVVLIFLNTTARPSEPIEDIKTGAEVQINCYNPLTVLGKAIVTTITPDHITVQSKGQAYTFDLTNVTIIGKDYAESSLLTASTRPESAFAKLLDLAENPIQTPPPDLRCSKPIPNFTYYPISGGRQILPYRNVNSRDAALGEVIRFVKSTHVSERLYELNYYVCGNFAHDLIKSAESAGIHCTLASLQFRGERIGHAVVAFHTTDYGLVFIDCTGGETPGKPGTYNTIGYIKPGKTYGRLPLDIGRIDPNHYEFYELTKAAINAVESKSIPAKDLKAEKMELADEWSSLQKFALSDSSKTSPLLKEKIEHYRQDAKNLKRDIAANELREQLREDPYMDYEKEVASVTLW